MIDVVDADHLPAIRVDDLLIEQVLAHREPGLIRMVEFERGFIRGQLHAAGRHGGDLVVAGHQRAVLAAADQQARDAVRLLVGNNEHFLDAANEVAGRIIGSRRPEFPLREA